MAHMGTRIAKLRREHKLSQQELAERVGVHQSFISKMEIGEQSSPNVTTLKRLAKVLGCTTDYLVGMYADDEEDEHVKLCPATVA
jgi:transcriptional regulator with XRE-family HTH domain